MTVDSDRQALDVAVACCIKVEAPTARVMRVLDTKHLEWLLASEPVLDELLATGRCELAGPLVDIAFDDEGQFTLHLPS